MSKRITVEDMRTKLSLWDDYPEDVVLKKFRESLPDPTAVPDRVKFFMDQGLNVYNAWAFYKEEVESGQEQFLTPPLSSAERRAQGLAAFKHYLRAEKGETPPQQFYRIKAMYPTYKPDQIWDIYYDSELVHDRALADREKKLDLLFWPRTHAAQEQIEAAKADREKSAAQVEEEPNKNFPILDLIAELTPPHSEAPILNLEQFTALCMELRHHPAITMEAEAFGGSKEGYRVKLSVDFNSYWGTTGGAS